MRLEQIVSSDDCMVTRVWGFSPETWGALGFPKAGTTDKWLAKGHSLFVVCFVSHHAAKHIEEADEGRVLGIYELGPERVELEYDGVLHPDHLSDRMMRNSNDEFRWPIGLRALRAWRFQPNTPRTAQALPKSRKLSWNVSTDLTSMPFDDFALLNQTAYRLEEVAVFGQPAPIQTILSDPNAVPSSVYLFACESEMILARLPHWKAGDALIKIGCASDVGKRLSDFNDNPLARITGLRLGRVTDHWVGEANARSREQEMLEHVASVGRPACDLSTEFFFVPKTQVLAIAHKLKGALKVA